MHESECAAKSRSTRARGGLPSRTRCHLASSSVQTLRTMICSGPLRTHRRGAGRGAFCVRHNAMRRAERTAAYESVVPDRAINEPPLRGPCSRARTEHALHSAQRHEARGARRGLRGFCRLRAATRPPRPSSACANARRGRPTVPRHKAPPTSAGIRPRPAPPPCLTTPATSSTCRRFPGSARVSIREHLQRCDQSSDVDVDVTWTWTWTEGRNGRPRPRLRPR